MTLAILQYNAGNVNSVTHALRRLGVEPVLTDDPETLRAAERVLFPGVGEASTAMQYLRERGLDAVLRSLRQPVLGICLGMQLLCTHSEEGNTEALGLIPTRVRRFPPQDKVPHMGWNTLQNTQGPLFEGLPAEPFVYYVHSYYAELCPETIATTEYILPFSAALRKNNFWAVQFHPEKSSTVGARILENFLSIS